MTVKPATLVSAALPKRAATSHKTHFLERWSFVSVAVMMIATSIAGFVPAILNPGPRRGPISPLAAIHGIIFFAWLLLFLIQSLLIQSGRVVWHRRLGVATACVLALMVPLGYQTTIAMVRRGYDLSGDQLVGLPGNNLSLDAQTASAFNLIALVWFTLLAVIGLCFRRRPAIHKRLMLLATIQLMTASVAHLLGHAGALKPGPIIGSFSPFLLAAVARDWLVDKRVHPLTAALAVISVALLPVEAGLIGPSAPWHRLLSWLAGSA